MKTVFRLHILFSLCWLMANCSQHQDHTGDLKRDSVLTSIEIVVINQTLRYLDTAQVTPNWDSPYNGVISNGLTGKPVWVGFMSGVFMPPQAKFDQRVKQMEGDWNTRFRGIDTKYRAVFHKLLDFWNPNFPPEINSIPPDKWPKSGPDDVMWQDWKGFPASDKYRITAFVTPNWLQLHALSDEKILSFPYRKLGTLSISHVAFSSDMQFACYLYDIWGASGHRYGVVFAKKEKDRWVREGDKVLSIS